MPSGLIAFFSESGRSHDEIVAWLAENDAPMVVSPYVVAEVDYLVATRKGVEAELAVLAELAAGAYELATMGSEDLAAASSLLRRAGGDRVWATSQGSSLRRQQPASEADDGQPRRLADRGRGHHDY